METPDAPSPSMLSEALSAVLGLASGHELSQARPQQQHYSGFGLACMFQKPKPGHQAITFQ